MVRIVLEGVISFFLVAGAVFALIGAIGLVRLPDCFMRLHAPTKATTLGVGGVLAASLLYVAQSGRFVVHELLVAMFLFVTAPVSALMLAGAAIHLQVRSTARLPKEEDRSLSSLDLSARPRERGGHTIGEPEGSARMHEREIYITDFDMRRIRQLLEGVKLWSARDREHLTSLGEELDRAHVVAATDIPADVVTMNSRLSVRDLDSGRVITFTLVFPSDADVEQDKISVLAPLGTAVLGYRLGDTFEWKMPARVRRLNLEQVLYQPEAAGDYHL